MKDKIYEASFLKNIIDNRITIFKFLFDLITPLLIWTVAFYMCIISICFIVWVIPTDYYIPFFHSHILIVDRIWLFIGLCYGIVNLINKK